MFGRCKRYMQALALAASVAIPGAATFAADQPEEVVDPNTGALTFSFGVDFTNAYFFRGIGQENQGLIVQPWGTLAAALVDGDSFDLGVSVGTWNSLHNGPTGTEDFGDFRTDPQLWYESDFIVSLDAVFGKFGASLIYTAYMSPNDSFETIQEIAVKFKYDDSEMLGDFKLSPYVLVAFELDDQADFGNSINGDTDTDEGVYMEIGIAPGFTLIQSETCPVTLSFPIIVGLSLDNYYEDSDDQDDDMFGYASVGVVASVPLPIPPRFGSWTLSAGVTALFLGGNAEDLSHFNGTGEEDFHIIGRVGISASY